MRGELRSPRTHSRLQLVECTAAGITRERTMSITCVTAWVLVLLLLPLHLVLWAMEDRQQRARRLRRYGWPQQRIANHLGCSRSTVRRLLA